MAFCRATGKKFLSKTQIQEETDQRSAKETEKCKSTLLRFHLPHQNGQDQQDNQQQMLERMWEK